MSDAEVDEVFLLVLVCLSLLTERSWTNFLRSGGTRKRKSVLSSLILSVSLLGLRVFEGVWRPNPHTELSFWRAPWSFCCLFCMAKRLCARCSRVAATSFSLEPSSNPRIRYASGASIQGGCCCSEQLPRTCLPSATRPEVAWRSLECISKTIPVVRWAGVCVATQWLKPNAIAQVATSVKMRSSGLSRNISVSEKKNNLR